MFTRHNTFWNIRLKLHLIFICCIRRNQALFKKFPVQFPYRIKEIKMIYFSILIDASIFLDHFFSMLKLSEYIHRFEVKSVCTAA